MAGKLSEIYNVGAVYLVTGLHTTKQGEGDEVEGPFWSEMGFLPSKEAGIDWTLTGMGISSVIRPSDSVEARQLGAGDISRRGITLMT